MADEITPEDAQRALRSDRQVAVIDVREPIDYCRSHVPGSTPVSRRELEARLPAVVPDRHAGVILCDRRGERAHLDADWLERLGHEDVAYLAGGMEAWEAAGLDTVEAHEGVHATASHFRSKEFGERVQVEEDLEQIRPSELADLREDGTEDVLLADVRTPEEYRESTIPGALNVEGVDLGLYVDRLRDEDQPVVVNCGGRTRSIIGTATLEKLGVENVYELENGTMGWELAGYDLERGADRHVRAMEVDEEYRDAVRTETDALLDEQDVPTVTNDEFRALLADDEEVVYPVDVRTREEYEAGHVPNAIHVPGGQAIQTTDEHFAVRNGTVVFVSNDRVRAAITAYWFAEMGFPNVAVLAAGLDGWRADGRPVETGRGRAPPKRDEIEVAVTYVSASALADRVGPDGPSVVDVGPGEQFERGHVPGARWVPRYELEGWLDDTGVETDDPVVLACPDGEVSTYAAAALDYELGYENVCVLAGGTDAWGDADRPLETGTDGMAFERRDEIPKPYHQGDWAKRTYLEWEEKLGEKFE
ncbi:MAG: rhodanese-like domain-containing protein [Haloferacaceae archaeon]